MHSRFLNLTAAVSATLILAACGGGGGSGSAAPGGSTNATVSGSVVKGPVNGATVNIRDASNNAIITSTTTNASGAYSVSINFNGTVLIEATGGSFVDEASSATVNLSTSLYTVATTTSGGTTTAMVTPFTTFAYAGAAGNNGTVTSAAFTSSLADVAQIFRTTPTVLTTSTPVVSGSVNDYGALLRGFSMYIRQNFSAATLQQALARINTMSEEELASTFSTQFSAAYAAANGGRTITLDFSDSGVTVGGTGAGGGSGQCGVNVQGTVTSSGFTVPLNLDYCITGIAASSCNSGNASLSQAISGQSGVAGAADLRYTYSPSCVANPVVTINLQ